MKRLRLYRLENYLRGNLTKKQSELFGIYDMANYPIVLRPYEEISRIMIFDVVKEHTFTFPVFMSLIEDSPNPFDEFSKRCFDYHTYFHDEVLAMIEAES